MADERTTDTAANTDLGITDIWFKGASEAQQQYGTIANVNVEINGMFWIRDIQIKVSDTQVAYVSMPSRCTKAKTETTKGEYYDTIRFKEEEDLKSFKNQILRFVLGDKPAEVEQPTITRSNKNKETKQTADMIGGSALGE
jgi:DNA-binding cell septation regulator SpoVG